MVSIGTPVAVGGGFHLSSTSFSLVSMRLVLIPVLASLGLAGMALGEGNQTCSACTDKAPGGDFTCQQQARVPFFFLETTWI